MLGESGKPQTEDRLKHRYTQNYLYGVVGGLAKSRIVLSFTPIERNIYRKSSFGWKLYLGILLLLSGR